MNVSQSFTFKVKLTDQHEFLTSSGRWDTAKEAAIAAGEYLVICADNGYYSVTVKVEMLEELDLLQIVD